MILLEACCETIPVVRPQLPLDRNTRWQLFRCEACGTEALSDPTAQLCCWKCLLPFWPVEDGGRS